MKQYKVRIWVGSSPSEILVTALSSANALSVTKKLYPTARVIGASETQ
ncbi:hypothetical protein [Flavobacterium sp.]